MKIAIAEKLRPFSHLPGAQCLLPGTSCLVQAFPSLLRVGQIEIPLGIEGPVENFTVQQDLEKNCVGVFGKKLRVKIQATPQGVEVGIGKNREFFPEKSLFFLPPAWERLSFGSHKAQDVDLMWRRFDLREILPILYGLGQKIPPLPQRPHLLLEKTHDLPSWERFCKASLHSLFVPRLLDDQHQGLGLDARGEGNPAYLLREAAMHLRSFFFRQEGNRLELLPSPLFAAGRMVDVQVAGVGSLDLEWTKQTLRRVHLRASQTGEVALCLPPTIHAFLCKMRSQDKGTKHLVAEPFCIERGKTYFLDRFCEK